MSVSVCVCTCMNVSMVCVFSACCVRARAYCAAFVCTSLWMLAAGSPMQEGSTETSLAIARICVCFLQVTSPSLGRVLVAEHPRLSTRPDELGWKTVFPLLILSAFQRARLTPANTFRSVHEWLYSKMRLFPFLRTQPQAEPVGFPVFSPRHQKCVNLFDKTRAAWKRLKERSRCWTRGVYLQKIYALLAGSTYRP